MKKSRCLYQTSVAGLFSALLLTLSAEATTITVTSTADAGGTCPGANCTLRQAIATAVSGATINFSLPANSPITLTSGDLMINNNLTISGPGANLLTVQRSAAAGELHIFRIGAGPFNVIISGLTIANGNASSGLGGGIYNTSTGTVTIIKSIISGTTSGGGIASFAGTMNIVSSTISGNTGGGFYQSGGTLTITNSTISDNPSEVNGGGISNTGDGTATITNSTVSGNSAAFGGGIYNESGTVTITNGTISGNSAARGGGIFNAAVVNGTNTVFALNTASIAGPDFYGTLTSHGYNLIGNTSGTGFTGTVTGNQYNVDAKLDTLRDNGGSTKTHALLSGSTAINGGQSSGSNVDQRGLARPVVASGSALPSGGDGADIGAYEVQADLLPGCSNLNRVVKNTDDADAGSLRDVIASVCAGSTITFAPNVRGAINLTSDQLLINKSLTIQGPGPNLLSVQRSVSAGNLRIFNIAPAAVIANISGLTIANGSAPPDGISSGGIASLGTLTLTNCTVSGNTNAQTNGGGILNSSGTLNIINSTISGNSTTAGFAGGIYNYAGTLTITNSTISGNSATEFSLSLGVGGGILNSNGATAIITNSTISSNTGQYRGGGIRNTSDSTVRAKNTIIALNTAGNGGGPDVDGSMISESFNLIGNSSDAMISPVYFSDQKGTPGSTIDPMLGPLQNNGGPTLTRALLAGSPAIDKGHTSGSFFDQRGFIRSVDFPNIDNALGGDGDGGDIGAFEFGAQPLRITSITRLTNGHVVLQGIGVPSNAHTIEAAPDPNADSFGSNGSATSDGSGLLQHNDAGAVGLTKRFYRLSFP